MPAKNRILDVLLLVTALVGPLLHLLGMVVRGTSLLNADYARLVMTYVALSLSAAAGMWVALRNKGLWRLVATIAVLANLASIGYAAQRWTRDMQRSLAEVDLSPMEVGKVGVLVAAGGYAETDLAEARDLVASVVEALRRVDLDTAVSVRRITPASDADQAERQCRQLGAHVIIWQTRNAEGVATYHVTSLGAIQTAVDLEPLDLMLLMSTQGTFSVSRTFTEVGKEVPVLSRAVVPVAAGMVAQAIGQPVLAAAQFQVAQQVKGLPAAALSSVHNYRGTALLMAKRPDLAIAEYEAVQQLGPDAAGWIGQGNAKLALREWRAATRAYQEALKVDAYNAAAYCGIGATHAAERNIEKALVAYNQAVALQPKWAVPYALLGRAYELIADIPAAKQAYETCAGLAGAQTGLLAAVSTRAVSVVQNPPTPVPTATPLPTSTPAPTPVLPMYTVKKGDTMESIADELGTTIERLVEVNNIDDPSLISIGQKLVIPEEEGF